MRATIPIRIYRLPGTNTKCIARTPTPLQFHKGLQDEFNIYFNIGVSVITVNGERADRVEIPTDAVETEWNDGEKTQTHAAAVRARVLRGQAHGRDLPRTGVRSAAVAARGYRRGGPPAAINNRPTRPKTALSFNSITLKYAV